jgi:hypothetical protein
MLRLLVQIRRRGGLSDEQFYGHWETQHADLVRRIAPATGCVRYVQARRIPSPEIDGFARSRNWQPAPDGMAELWWLDQGAMLQAWASEAAKEAGSALRADEREFADIGGLRGIVAREETVFDYSFTDEDTSGCAVKMVVEVWKRPDLSADAFADRWRGAHADLARRVAKAMGFMRYVQNHRERSFPIDLAEARGWLPQPDGITEVWWPSESAMKKAFAEPEAAEASAVLQNDEAAFVDSTRMSAFLAVERPVFSLARC